MRNTFSQYVAIGLAILGICLASGCTTKDTVSSRFPELQENINVAKKAGAEQYARKPLMAAEDKLAKAKQAVAQQDMASANALVDEAMIDAEYARAMAPTEKAKSDGMKLREEIQAVRNEIKQLSGVN